jgi:hypothetical protein
MTAAADRAARRRLPTERFARKLDEYVPESGELRAWTISELEQSLLADTSELARDVIESRLDIDPARVPEKPPRCPDSLSRRSLHSRSLSILVFRTRISSGSSSPRAFPYLLSAPSAA